MKSRILTKITLSCAALVVATACDVDFIAGPGVVRSGEMVQYQILIKPEITGETVKGRSISAIRKLRPLNSNFPTAHAVTRPKMVFRGTTTMVTIKVSRMAAWASGSLNEAR